MASVRCIPGNCYVKGLAVGSTTYTVTTATKSATATVTVTAPPPPPLALTAIAYSKPIGSYVNCRFVATATGGTPPYTYTWSIRGESGPQFSPNAVYNSTSSTFTTKYYNSQIITTTYFTVTATVTDAAGRSASRNERNAAAGYGQIFDSQYCGY